MQKGSAFNSELESPNDNQEEPAHFPIGSNPAQFKINPSSMGAESGNGFGI